MSSGPETALDPGGRRIRPDVSRLRAPKRIGAWCSIRILLALAASLSAGVRPGDASGEDPETSLREIIALRRGTPAGDAAEALVKSGDIFGAAMTIAKEEEEKGELVSYELRMAVASIANSDDPRARDVMITYLKGPHLIPRRGEPGQMNDKRWYIAERYVLEKQDPEGEAILRNHLTSPGHEDVKESILFMIRIVGGASWLTTLEGYRGVEGDDPKKRVHFEKHAQDAAKAIRERATPLANGGPGTPAVPPKNGRSARPPAPAEGPNSSGAGWSPAIWVGLAAAAAAVAILVIRRRG